MTTNEAWIRWMVQTFQALKTSQHLHHLLPFSAELQPVPLLNWRLQLSQAPLKVAITAAFIADKEHLGVINNLSSDDKLLFTLFFFRFETKCLCWGLRADENNVKDLHLRKNCRTVEKTVIFFHYLWFSSHLLKNWKIGNVCVLFPIIFFCA